MKKVVLLALAFAFSTALSAQNLNGYKYAYIPSKFDVLKHPDKYKVNTLSKLFMQKYGFETYIESETAPYDFLNNNCNKVYVDLLKDNSLFLTRLQVVLKDCNGKVLFTSKEGSSKSKDLAVAYNEALRQAFASFETLHHKYDPNIVMATQVPTTNPNTVTFNTKVVDKETEESVSTNANVTSGTLYAQPIQNGFQLVNAEPRVVMKLYKTSVKDVYTAIKDTTQGVLVAKNSEWFFEYYQNDKLISEKIDVKF